MRQDPSSRPCLRCRSAWRTLASSSAKVRPSTDSGPPRSAAPGGISSNSGPGPDHPLAWEAHGGSGRGPSLRKRTTAMPTPRPRVYLTARRPRAGNGAQAAHPAAVKPELIATGPDQVCSWDIAKLHGPAKWMCYHLYVILDIFSAAMPSAALAEKLIAATCAKQGIGRGHPPAAAGLADPHRRHPVPGAASDDVQLGLPGRVRRRAGPCQRALGVQ